MNTETPQAALDALAEAFARDRHGIDYTGCISAHERADAGLALAAIRSLPVEDRASLLGFVQIERAWWGQHGLAMAMTGPAELRDGEQPIWREQGSEGGEP